MKLPAIEDILLFENEDLLVFNKPTGITSEGDNAEQSLSLSDIVKKKFPEAMICHRLDKETSGVIIAARNAEWYRNISIQFQKRIIQKEYHAIATGVHQFQNQEIIFPLTKKGNYKAVVDKKDGKEATTIVNSLEIFKNYTFLQAFPLSGRFHQIRIHLASIGAPLLGDALYGGKPFFLSEVKRKYRLGKYDEEQAVLNRTALHAHSLSFNYTQNNQEEIITIEAPYPKDFAVTLELLRKYNGR